MPKPVHLSCLLAFIQTLLIGCATPSSTKLDNSLNSLFAYRIEKLDPPVEEREKDALPPKTGAPTPLEACSGENNEACSVPFTGILLDSYLLSKYKLIVAERDKLRSLIAIERNARKNVQDYYNLALSELANKARRSWWEENSGTLGLAAGVVFTSIIAIGLTYALNPAISK